MALQTKEFTGNTGRPGVWTWKIVVSENYYIENGKTSTKKVQITIDNYIGRPSGQSTSYYSGSATLSFGAAGQSYSQSYSGNESNITGGSWRYMASHTFVVDNTGTKDNPTQISVSGSMSGASFSPYSGSASGTMALTPLHEVPKINTASMVETNSVLTALNVPNTTIVRYLSKKTITLNVTTYDSATATYRLRHLNSDYALPSSSTYQSSNVFTNVDYTTHDVAIGDGKANLIQDIKDSLDGEATDWVYVSINGTAQKPSGIAYSKPTIERASTSIKRKSGGGTTLTDNKAVLNLKATFYKSSDVIGNNNNIQQIGYKIWLQNASEPSNYTTLTPTISGGNITISNFEINNTIYTKTYYYKIILKDRFGYQDIVEGTLPTGQSVWTEYKDRVDFLKLTVGGYNPFEYSTNEIIVGTWVDGKPIYRKVIDVGSVNWTSSPQTFSHNISNLDVCIKLRWFGYYSVNSRWYMNWDAINARNIVVTSSNIEINNVSSNTTFSKNYIIIEYTKTTD